MRSTGSIWHSPPAAASVPSPCADPEAGPRPTQLLAAQRHAMTQRQSADCTQPVVQDSAASSALSGIQHAYRAIRSQLDLSVCTVSNVKKSAN